MSWTTEQDEYVVSLLKAQTNVAVGSEEWLRLRNKAAAEIVKALRSTFQSYVRNWKARYNIDMSDGESLIYENLLIALDTYKPDKAYGKFIPFLWRVNSCMFKNYLIKIYAQKRTPQIATPENKERDRQFLPVYSLHTPAPNQTSFDEIPETLENTIPDPVIVERVFQYKTAAQKLYEKADLRQKRILKRLYFGYTPVEISQKLKLSIPQISISLGKLRKTLGESFLQNEIVA